MKKSEARREREGRREMERWRATALTITSYEKPNTLQTPYLLSILLSAIRYQQIQH